MKKSKYNYKIYNGKSIKKLLENSRIYFMVFFFSASIIIGSTALSSSSELLNNISSVIDSYIISKTEQGIFLNFCNSFSVSIIFLFLNIFLGFSLIGYPLIMILPFLRGMGMGLFCGYLYSVFKLMGLGYSILVIYPGAIVSNFAFLLACNESCEYSKNAHLKAIQGRGQFEKDETKIYLTRQLIYICLSAASSIIDAVFSKVFSSFFEI